LSFQVPEKNRFKYKLTGVDPGWVDAGTRRVAYYNNIRPGAYTFQVQGCNSDGVWNALGATVKFTFEPHYWQTWWFKSFTFLFSVGLIAFLVRYLTQRRLQHKLLALEKERAVADERARIAQDMHDDLGARLTEIMFLSGVAARSKDGGPDIKSHVSNIGHAARDLVQNLDAIVWAVDPMSDDLESLASYFHDHASRFLDGAGIRGRFRIQTGLPAQGVSSKVRHELFLILKETLNNIAKHAECSEVEFELCLRANRLFIQIADNGKGFATGAGDVFSKGLRNMVERAGRIGGQLNIESEPGKGTRVTFEIALGPGKDI
jgi:signal transduction histidine kinase